MRAGKLNKRMTFWRRAENASDFEAGDPVDVVVDEFWCGIVWAKGGEGEAGEQTRSTTVCTISTRLDNKLAHLDSFWWATRDNQLTGETERFNFTSVVNVDEANREVVIEAVRA